MAADAELVAVWIPYIRAVIVRMIFGPRSGRSLVAAAMPERQRMALTDQGPIGGQEGDHLAIAGCRGRAVVGLPDDEERSRVSRLLPPGPTGLCELEDQAQGFHQGP